MSLHDAPNIKLVPNEVLTLKFLEWRGPLHMLPISLTLVQTQRIQF